MNGILQGTTPALVLELPEMVPVDTITKVELTIKQRGAISISHKADVQFDTAENTIIKEFSETETLALDDSQPLYYQLRVETPNGIYGTIGARVEVFDLYSKEVIS